MTATASTASAAPSRRPAIVNPGSPDQANAPANQSPAGPVDSFEPAKAAPAKVDLAGGAAPAAAPAAAASSAGAPPDPTQLPYRQPLTQEQMAAMYSKKTRGPKIQPDLPGPAIDGFPGFTRDVQGYPVGRKVAVTDGLVSVPGVGFLPPPEKPGESQTFKLDGTNRVTLKRNADGTVDVDTSRHHKHSFLGGLGNALGGIFKPIGDVVNAISKAAPILSVAAKLIPGLQGVSFIADVAKAIKGAAAAVKTGNLGALAGSLASSLPGIIKNAEKLGGDLGKVFGGETAKEILGAAKSLEAIQKAAKGGNLAELLGTGSLDSALKVLNLHADQVQGLADTVEKAKGVIDNVHQVKQMLDQGNLTGALGLVLEKTGHQDLAKRVEAVNKAINGAEAIKAALDGKSYTGAIQAALEMASNVQQGLGNGRPPGSEAFQTAEAISTQAVALENAIKSKDPAQIAAAALRLKAVVSNAKAGLYDLTSGQNTDSAKNALRTADAIQALDEGITYAAQGNLPLAAASFMEAVSQSRGRGASNDAHRQATDKMLEVVKTMLTMTGQKQSLGEVIKAVAPMIRDALELKKHEQAIGVEVPSLPDDQEAGEND